MRLISVITLLLFSTLWVCAAKAPDHPTPVSGDGVTTPSGLKYWDLKVGKGKEATPGKTVWVNYTGWLENGAKFDSSFDRGWPYFFRIGDRRAIPGWEEGVVGMKVGGKRQLRIPPELGYGSDGRPPLIPPNSVLIFDIQLLDVK